MATSQTSPTLRITEVPDARVRHDAENLVELCGGDRLEAWRVALAKALVDRVLGEAHWIAVADAVVEHQTLPLPRGIAAMLLSIVEHATLAETLSVSPALARIYAIATDPRVEAWALATRLTLRNSPRVFPQDYSGTCDECGAEKVTVCEIKTGPRERGTLCVPCTEKKLGAR